MPGKEKAIFREVYNLLEANLNKPKMEKHDWEGLKLQTTRLAQEKFTNFDDKMLFIELMSVIVDHIERKQGNGNNPV